MKCMIDNKMVEIDDKYKDYLGGEFYEMKNSELKHFLRISLTTGDLDNGFNCPNLERYITQNSPELLKRAIEKGIEIEMRMVRG